MEIGGCPIYRLLKASRYNMLIHELSEYSRTWRAFAAKRSRNPLTPPCTLIAFDMYLSPVTGQWVNDAWLYKTMLPLPVPIECNGVVFVAVGHW